MILEKVFALSLLVFGTRFVVRRMQELADEHFIGAKTSEAVFMGLFFLMLGTVLLWPGHFQALCAVSISLLVLVTTFVKIQFYRRETRFYSEFRLFLDRVILQMRAGNSFRHAVQIATEQCDAFVQQKIRRIMEIVTFSVSWNAQDWNPFLQELIQEFEEVDRQAHRGLPRLLMYRERLQIADDFRRKSGQATRHVRIQSLLMSVLYLALLLYVATHFSIAENSTIVLTSVTIFVTGLVWIHMKGTKVKWNI